jgi:hypothetical protein
MGSRDKIAAAASNRRVLFVVFASCFAFLTFVYTTSHLKTAPASASAAGSRSS